MCSTYSVIGHREVWCPSTAEGVCTVAEDTQQNHYDTGKMGSQSDALVALPWDTKAEYNMISPIKSYQKRAQTKAKKKPAQPIITQDPDLMETQEGLITPQCNSQEEMGTHYEYPLDASGVIYANTVQALEKRVPQATQKQDQSCNPAQEEPQKL
ncbi:hypothetical protein DSO57_1014403 [Entomophthora muscae]|uniref:Uncharacterized protein n=1 Tax=Entomophthora muscae TaxID=34485 RepID=A0ACC2UFI2_9FUNG|nr:hypothetical protein DSO57_1014403 [Entomophthora muscae]